MLVLVLGLLLSLPPCRPLLAGRQLWMGVPKARVLGGNEVISTEQSKLSVWRNGKRRHKEVVGKSLKL